MRRTLVSTTPVEIENAKKANASEGRRKAYGMQLLWLIVVVFGAQLTFATWANGQGFLWGDALSRSTSALVSLYSADPHLAAIGFVWMPLPTLLEIVPVALYPLWPGVVASGFASSIVTVLAGILTAAVVFATSERFGLSRRFGAAYSLLVSFSPMIFLFSTNGMSEGVAAPFMIGSVCCLLMFWDGGQRRYVAASAVCLALSFACLYQTVHFGAAMFVALVLGIFSSENAWSAPQGRWRAVEGLAILFLIPSAYVGILWVTANAVIMGDPLYFATSIYSNEGFIASSGTERLSDSVAGSLTASLGFAAIRTLPFLLPVLFMLALRVLERRLFSLNALTLTAVALVVPLGLIVSQLYAGQSFGWLRYFVYPLYVAAGWSIYEVAKSGNRRRAMLFVLVGWLLVIPASLWIMSDARYAPNEEPIVSGLLSGRDAGEMNYPVYLEDVESVSRALDALKGTENVLMDSSNAWPIEATVRPGTLKENIIPTSDERFYDALEDPAEYNVEYLLVPNPGAAPQDLIAAEYPRLWRGGAEDFILERDFSQTGLDWRLYEANPR